MADRTANHKAVFRILDAMEGPHEGRILKLRLQTGEPPTMKELKGARMTATSPDGAVQCEIRVAGFVLFGGRPSDERLARTGRIDVNIDATDDAVDRVSARWQVVGPI